MAVMIRFRRRHNVLKNGFVEAERGHEKIFQMAFFDGQLFFIRNVLIRASAAHAKHRTEGFHFVSILGNGQGVKENARLSAMLDKIFLENLEVKCKIGIFDWERKIRQKIALDLEFPADIRKAAKRDRIQDTTDYKAIAKETIRFVSTSSFFLIETLAERLAQNLLKKFRLREIKIRLSKPGAIRGAKNVGIEILRKRS